MRETRVLIYAMPRLLARPVDVILLDTTLPDADDALSELGAPDQKVVVLGVVECEEDVVGWAEKGAAGMSPATARATT